MKAKHSDERKQNDRGRRRKERDKTKSEQVLCKKITRNGWAGMINDKHCWI